jgi:energy-coupling factor transport system ATP-binding protein
MIFPVEIKNLHFRYPESTKSILNGIELRINKGEVLAIVGLSGCGKSTLCYCICGIIPHVFDGEMQGEVLIFGSSTKDMKLPAISTNVGIVFQDPDTQLFSPTAEDEIAFGPENLCVERNEIGERISQNLELVAMEKNRYANPENISGGEKQLIALASTLSLNPQIIIFDEAMSQIDDAGKLKIKKAIRDLKAAGKTIIMIEHDLANLDVTDRVLLLNNGELSDFKGSLR